MTKHHLLDSFLQGVNIFDRPSDVDECFALVSETIIHGVLSGDLHSGPHTLLCSAGAGAPSLSLGLSSEPCMARPDLSRDVSGAQ